MDLKKHIRSIPDYPKKGILFRDITTLIKNAEAFKYTNDKIIELAETIDFDKVAAIESRGFVFASTVSYLLKKKEIKKTVEETKMHVELQDLVHPFSTHYQEFGHGATHLLFKRAQGPDSYLADATLFLEAAGILCIAWMWLKQATTAQNALNMGAGEQEFYLGKLQTARYTMEYELIKLKSLLPRFSSLTYPTLTMKNEWF